MKEVCTVYMGVSEIRADVRTMSRTLSVSSVGELSHDTRSRNPVTSAQDVISNGCKAALRNLLLLPLPRGQLLERRVRLQVHTCDRGRLLLLIVIPVG